MKKLFVTLFLLVGCVAANLYAQKPVLKFNENGKFKIVQFTDTHCVYGDSRSDIAYERINEVLDAEKPDLVIFTGDVIFDKPAEKGMRSILELASKRKIPFGVTFGNHDDESDLTRTQLLEVIKTIPYNLTDSVPGVSGSCNYTVPVLASDGKGQTKAVLYCFDSHAYSTIKDIEGYDYIKIDQLAWYEKQSTQYTQQNGGTPLPALAFFHIPLLEYWHAAMEPKNQFIGTRMEAPGSSNFNSGLFAAMKNMGDVKGIFVGHEHDNDYVTNWKGILLGYGRYTGGDTVYNHLSNGARVIELTEGETGFYTWIRLKDNVTINKVYFKDNVIKVLQ